MPNDVYAGAESPDVPAMVKRVTMQFEVLCKCSPDRVLICKGESHEVTCPDCGQAYRITFLHYDEKDEATFDHETGKPNLGIALAWKPRSSIIRPRM
jgi:hypothetical protein